MRFHRLPDRRYCSTAERGDGVTVLVPGYDRPTGLPHDLVHFVVERELALPRGIWGSIAAGAMFPTMKVVSGRQRPHPAKRSTAVLKAHGDHLGMAELLGAFFAHILDEGDKGRAEDPAELLRSFERRTAGLPAPPLTPDQVTGVRRALGKAGTAWRGIPVGGALMLDWPLPPTRVQLTAPRKGPATRRR